MPRIQGDYLQHQGPAEDKPRKESVVVADNGGTHADSMRNYLNSTGHFGTYRSQSIFSNRDGDVRCVKMITDLLEKQARHD
jgi:hypothetical protein